MKIKKRLLVIVAFLLAVTFIVVIINMGSKKGKTDAGKGAIQKVEKVLLQISEDVENAKSGKYPNLKVENLNVDVNNVNELYRIDIIPNQQYKEKSYEDNLALVQSTVDKFYGKNVDMSGAAVYIVEDENKENETQNSEEQNDEGYEFNDFKRKIEEGELKGSEYFLIFKDNREDGGKGFIQIDASLVSIWLSKGELSETSPMYGYETKRVYNLTLSDEGLDDKVKLMDGEITVKDAVLFIEKYLNSELPYEKNEEFQYEVAEIRVLDANGCDALGFCVRKKYNNIPFDYIDGTTEGIYNSDFWDDRGELCTAKTTEVDNMCGLGGDTYRVEKSGGTINKMCSLDEALKYISESVGNNSVYDIYGAEIIYQFTPVADKTDSDMVSKYSGRLKWKIVARNENDDKDTWFYIDIETGKITHRFKKIYGE